MIKHPIVQGKHCTSRIVDEDTRWLFIACPIMDHGKLDFKTWLQVFRELKGYEKQIEEDPGLIGWCAKTWIGNLEIVKLLYRLQAKPYQELHNVYWFSKRIKGNKRIMRHV